MPWNLCPAARLSSLTSVEKCEGTRTQETPFALFTLSAPPQSQSEQTSVALAGSVYVQLIMRVGRCSLLFALCRLADARVEQDGFLCWWSEKREATVFEMSRRQILNQAESVQVG